MTEREAELIRPATASAQCDDNDEIKKLPLPETASGDGDAVVLPTLMACPPDGEAGARATPRRCYIPLEEYLYYADMQHRQGEAMASSPQRDDISGPEGMQPSPALSIRRSPIRYMWGPPTPIVQQVHSEEAEKTGGGIIEPAESDDARRPHFPDEGFSGQDRALLRRLTIMSAFFLLTTDILGPFSAGYVVSQLGYVPAVILYIVFGLAAFAAGIILNTLYLRLDSDQLPIRSYSGLAQRIWGKWGRIIVDVFLFVQLLIFCAGIILTNGQSLGQIIDGISGGKHHVCFSVIVLIFLAISVFLSHIRSLHSIGSVAIFAVALSVVSMICCIAFVYTSPPNYDEAQITFGIQPGPVHTAAFENLPLSNTLTGLMNMVFAYGGALLFIDILNEMKRPWDFYKSLFGAQLFIMTVYMGFGMLIYARQGQFSQSLAYYGASKYAYQSFGNAVGFTTGTIVGLLYGNVAQKQIYYIVVRDWCKGPPLMSRQGFRWWMLGNIIFWCLAYVLGVSIPQVQTVAGLVAALCTLQFSYSFPFLFKLSFDMQLDAMREDGVYTLSTQMADSSAAPNERLAHRIDTWKQWSRWKRAILSGNRKVKACTLVLCIASVGLALLGIGACIVAISDTFKTAKPTSFGCVTP